MNDRMKTQLQETGQVYLGPNISLAEVIEIVGSVGLLPSEVRIVRGSMLVADKKEG